MPKKRAYRRKRRNRKNFVAIPFNIQQALGTLADETVIDFSILDAVFAEDFFAISVDAQWAVNGHATGEGPCEVGFAHGDLTQTEIKECIDADLVDPDDIIARERARRPVRRVGSFPMVSSVETLNDGKPIRSKLRIMIGNGHELKAWLMNHSGAALTTGGILTLTGTLYGRWQR